MHHSISMIILFLTHWNLSDTFNKFQLCTSNLKVPTHKSNYVYRYVRFANSFSYKAIFTLDNWDFEQWCIIQYRWKFCPSHIKMRLTQLTNFSFVHLIYKFQLMNQTMYIATCDSQIVLRQSDIDIRKSRFWARMHHSISINILSVTHWNVSDTFK